NDTAQSIVEKYQEDWDVVEAIEHYHASDPANATPKPNIITNSMRVYINGLETPLTPEQIEEKRALERTLEARVRDLKSRMAQASRTRRQAIKAKRAQRQATESAGLRTRHQKFFNRFRTVSGPPAPSAPTASLGQPLGVDDAAQRQTNHWLAVEKRRSERPSDVTERANSCKAEYLSQKFNNFLSKRYSVKVHALQDAPDNAGPEPETPDNLELRPFKPYTYLDSVKRQWAKPSTRATSSRAGPLSKAHVVMAITGRHQITTLNVGQLGRNVGHAVSAAALPSSVQSPE
ncbi:hypothetical protein BGW41_007947, partial [Actinomortierella wolfii]